MLILGEVDWSFWFLITYEAQLPVAGPRWQGFRRLRDDLSGWIDRRFALSNDPSTPIGHRVRARGLGQRMKEEDPQRFDMMADLGALALALGEREALEKIMMNTGLGALIKDA